MLPISDILRWLVVVLLVLAFLAVAIWPGIPVLARLIALVACLCGLLMAMLLSQPFLWAFLGCAGAAALIGTIAPHNRHRREYADARVR